MFIYKVPEIISWICPDYVWHKKRTSPYIYLTFDDGPVSGPTDFVLEELGKRGMKATFFMVGENVTKHPNLARKVIGEGHRVGNHTQHHLDGTRTPTLDYLKDIRHCDQTFEDILGVRPGIFRPPYGRLGFGQGKKILKDYDIIFWDVLSGDYKPGISPNKSLQKIKEKTDHGSVILFHDQVKTYPFLLKTLPGFLDFIASKGYQTGLL